MSMQEITGAGILVLLGWMVVSSVRQPPTSLAGKDPIHEAPTQFVFNTQKLTDADGRIDIYASATQSAGGSAISPGKGDLLGSYAVGPDGLLYTDFGEPNQRVIAEYTPISHFNSPRLDLGGFGGVGDFGGDSRTHAFQAGVRYSPTRLGFGWVAPDLVVSPEAAGAGVSLFPSSRAVGYPWCHLGVGAWYMAPWGGGRPGFVLGVSTSFR